MISMKQLLFSFLQLTLACGIARSEIEPAVATLIAKGWQVAEQKWDRSLGTHRVIVKAPVSAEVVKAHIEWRRPDSTPERKAIIVVDLKTGKSISNVITQRMDQVSGDVLFEPVSGVGDYAVYFLPVKIAGGAFPTSKYVEPETQADRVWLEKVSTSPKIAEAQVKKFEALTAQDRWTEMEVIANPEEKSTLASKAREGLIFLTSGPEETVRMASQVPAKWTNRNNGSSQPIQTSPGANAMFQVAVWAVDGDLKNVRIEFPDSALRSPELQNSAFTCLSTTGNDWNGKAVTKTFNVHSGQVQAFWCTVQMPDNLQADTKPLKASFVVKNDGQPDQPGEVIFQLNPPPSIPEDAQPQSLSRLRWLNSTTAVDDEPAKGYSALQVQGKTIKCLGREVELSENGLPSQISSYYNTSVTKLLPKPTLQLLSGSARLVAVSTSGIEVPLTPSGFKFTKQSPGVVEWTSRWAADQLNVTLAGHMEFDGSLSYKLRMESGSSISLQDVRLEIPRTPESTQYLLGLNHETGLAKDEWEWKWDVVNRNQDSIWMGAVNGGLRVLLKADNYVRPGVNIHYRKRPLNDPPSWSGGGVGGIRYASHLLQCFSGPRTLEPGNPLNFDFDLLITPFHPLRTAEQWKDRYYHTSSVPKDTANYLEGAMSAGANVINIHQGNWLNPYINYPFLTWDKLRDFSKAAHDRGMRAKYYYTVRELTNWAPEVFALRSMGDEILIPGKGGGHPWGEEHLGGNYWQAWYEPGVQDVSFLTQPMSRWHNYYIEGLKWLCDNAGCDGIYLDDIAYDRSIMLRARKVLDRSSPRGALIDLHSWNEFHDGACRAHCPNLFMDSLPFVDRIWFGEGHHYTGPPAEHFLVELSGIPFGLMGEMLEGGGNPWFGLVHGMTGRLGWQGNPKPVWKLWDDFKVGEAEFIGWWAGKETPIQTNDDSVKASIWKKPGSTLLALANFSKEGKSTMVNVDWKQLGLDPSKAKFYVPAIPELRQREALLPVDKPLLLKSYSGMAILIDELEHPLSPVASPQRLGEVILEERFETTPDSAWSISVAPNNAKGVKFDHGCVLEVPANVHAYLERKVPQNAGAVSGRIWQDAADEAQQWGPGIALIWPDGKRLKGSIRKDNRITVALNGQETMPAGITVRAPIELAFHWDQNSIHVIAGGPAMGDLPEEIATIPRSQFSGQPAMLRVGKMPNDASPRDYGTAGSNGYNRIEKVQFFAAPK